MNNNNNNNRGRNRGDYNKQDSDSRNSNRKNDRNDRNDRRDNSVDNSYNKNRRYKANGDRDNRRNNYSDRNGDNRGRGGRKSENRSRDSIGADSRNNSGRGVNFNNSHNSHDRNRDDRNRDNSSHRNDSSQRGGNNRARDNAHNRSFGDSRQEGDRNRMSRGGRNYDNNKPRYDRNNSQDSSGRNRRNNNGGGSVESPRDRTDFGGNSYNRDNYRDNRVGDSRSRRNDNADRGANFKNGDNRVGDSRNRMSCDNSSRDNRNVGRGNKRQDNRDSRDRNYNDRNNRNNNRSRDDSSYIHNNDNDLVVVNSYDDSTIVDVNDSDTISEINNSNRKKKSIITMSFAEVKALCVELGYPEFHASQILDFIYKRNVLSFEDISPLPKSLREKLEEGYYIHNCTIKSIQTDETNTKKVLISLYDNKEIEAVILQKDDRITFCLSSQVGCAYGCKFCATGTMGFKRNLSSEEILAQFLLLRHEAKTVNSIVFMGMGEPLANAKNVFAAIKEINNYKGFNLGIRHITISTVGEVGGIKSLIERDLDVRLALSLHSLKEDVRSSIMPINKKYPLKRLLPMLKRYSSMGKRIITFEWVLIDGVNDTVNDAYRIVNLKRELPFKVNLIALNPVEGSIFKPSSKDNMKRFAKILTDNGVTVVQRFKQGQKILAGCGQLAIKSQKEKH